MKNPSIARLRKSMRKNVKLRAIAVKKVFGSSNLFFSRKRMNKAARSFYKKMVDKA